MPFDVKRGVELPETDEPGTQRTIRAIALVGLSPLLGGEKEVALAEEIRARHLVAADDLLSELRGNEAITEEHPAGALPVPQVTHAQVQRMQTALNRLRHQTEATWWIAQSDAPTRTLIETFQLPS